jgi:hypothetical protein
LEVWLDLKDESRLANDKNPVTAGVNDSDIAGGRVEKRNRTSKSSIGI